METIRPKHFFITVDVLLAGQVEYRKSWCIFQHSTFFSPLLQFLAIFWFWLHLAKRRPFTLRPNSCSAVWRQVISVLVLLLSPSKLSIWCPCLTRIGIFVATRIRCNFYCRLCSLLSIVVDGNCDKRGQTSRPVVGTEIQKSCSDHMRL